MSLTIGFTEKYFTLWDVSEYTDRQDLYTVYGLRHQYIQNLSFDKQKAIQKVEERTAHYDIDLSLRGRKSFQKELRKEYHSGVLLFGKYRGQSFVEVDDDDYLEWYWKTVRCTEKEDELLTKELMSRGILFTLSDGEVVTKSELDILIKEAFTKEVYELGHWETEKERLTKELLVRGTWGYETTYGWMDVIEMVEVGTNRLFYVRGSYSSDVEIERGSVIEITGSISHKKWYDRKLQMDREETQLKRVKISTVYS